MNEKRKKFTNNENVTSVKYGNTHTQFVHIKKIMLNINT